MPPLDFSNQMPVEKQAPVSKPLFTSIKEFAGKAINKADVAISKAVAKVTPGNKTTYTKAPKPEPVVYKIKDRPVEVLDDELKDLGGVIFGEANDDINEMRMIANVVINRANQSFKPIFQELSKKSKRGGFEFNAYAGEQYNKYMSDAFDFVSKAKADKIKQVLEEIKNGTLTDNTAGAIFFSHDAKGRIKTTKDLFENINHADS